MNGMNRISGSVPIFLVPIFLLEVLPDLDELSSSIHLEITQGGGHVGFIAGEIPFKPDYWLEQRIPEFLKQHLSFVCINPG